MKKGSKDDYITKDFFLHNLSEFAKDIVAGITVLTDEQNEKLDDHTKRLKKLEEGQNELKEDVQSLKTEVVFIKKDIQDLKWDTVSRSAFNAFKRKIQN